MKIDELIITQLLNAGCTISYANGIAYIITPDGECWDFTVPKFQGYKTETINDEIKIGGTT